MTWGSVCVLLSPAAALVSLIYEFARNKCVARACSVISEIMFMMSNSFHSDADIIQESDLWTMALAFIAFLEILL